MDTKQIHLLLLGCLLLLFAPSCACEEDEFGEVLRMEIPVNIGADRNVFQVGDTLWVETTFSKAVNVVGHQNDIELIGYKFFSSLYIAEISETDLRFFQSAILAVETGEVTLNQLGGYDYVFVESDNSYSIKFGVILTLPGTFSASTFTSDKQDGFRHPSMFTCKDNWRMNVFINRINIYSTQDNFEDFNAWRGGDGSFVQTFEGYRATAMYAFKVLE